MDTELLNIFKEFLSLDKDSIDYKRYKYFLFLYFNSHDIPSSIIELYNKDYKGDIYSFLSCNMDDLIDKKEETKNKKNNTRVNNEIMALKNKLSILNEIYNRVIKLIRVSEDNYKLNINIKDYRKELKHVSIRNRKNIKSKIDELNSLIVDVDFDYEFDLIYEYYVSNYVSNYIDDIDFKNLYSLELDLKDKIKSINDEIKNKKSKIVTSTTYDIDISDLYDRVSNGC